MGSQVAAAECSGALVHLSDCMFADKFWQKFGQFVNPADSGAMMDAVTKNFQQLTSSVRH